MTTEIQAEANRRNALQSTGPKTGEGIEATRFNALRHGLRALQTVVPGEAPEEWEAHRIGVVEDLKPEGAVELALAEQIAAKLWRLGRVVRYEADVITIGQNVEAIRHAHESATTRGSMSRPGPDDIPALKDVKAARRALESNEDKLKKCEAAYMVLEALEGFKDADLFSKEEWPIYDVLKGDLELTTKQTDGLFKTEDENFAVHHVRSMLKMKGTVEDVTKGMLAYWRDEKIPELREAVAKAKKVCKSVRCRYKAALDRLRLSRGLPNEAAVDKIQRYEAHLERGFHKALERLQALQEARGAFCSIEPQGGGGPGGHPDLPRGRRNGFVRQFCQWGGRRGITGLFSGTGRGRTAAT